MFPSDSTARHRPQPQGCSLSPPPCSFHLHKDNGKPDIQPTPPILSPLTVQTLPLPAAHPQPCLRLSITSLQQESQGVKVEKYLPHHLVQSLPTACGESEAQDHMEEAEALEVIWPNFPPHAETSSQAYQVCHSLHGETDLRSDGPDLVLLPRVACLLGVRRTAPW